MYLKYRSTTRIKNLLIVDKVKFATTIFHDHIIELAAILPIKSTATTNEV